MKLKNRDTFSQLLQDRLFYVFFRSLITLSLHAHVVSSIFLNNLHTPFNFFHDPVWQPYVCRS